MSKTEHTIRRLAEGGATQVTTVFHSYQAVEYEFYLPAVVWQHDVVQIFVKRLQSVIPGATIFKGTVGIWRTEYEDTHVYRMIVPSEKFDRENVRKTLGNEVDALMAKLAAWPKPVLQNEMIFTERDVMVSSSTIGSSG